jgi:hypothetical protein
LLEVTFLVNSRSWRFCVSYVLDRNSFLRTYGIFLPSSFTIVLSSPWNTLPVHSCQLSVQYRIYQKIFPIKNISRFIYNKRPFFIFFVIMRFFRIFTLRHCITCLWLSYFNINLGLTENLYFIDFLLLILASSLLIFFSNFIKCTERSSTQSYY